MGGFRTNTAVGPPGPAGSFESLEDIAALRALVATNPEAVVGVRQDDRGGLFFWDATPAVDDGGTRYNVGGVGTISAGWNRIPDGPLNARWFGMGTGDVDNATALQAAITVAALGTFSSSVYIPSGTYILANGVVVPSNVTIYGDGESTHLSATLGNDSVVIGGSGVALSNITIRDLRISGAFSRGIHFSAPGSNVRIERCHISGATVGGGTIAAIAIGAISNCWITDNTLDNNGLDDGDGGEGYEILHESGTTVSGFHVQRNTIVGNKTYISVACFDCENSDIIENDIDQGNTPSTLVPNALGYGILFYKSVGSTGNTQRNIVANNHVRNCAGMGIYLATSLDSVVEGNTVRDVMKQNNEVALPLGAISFNASTGLIANNTIKTSGAGARHGINFTQPNTNVSGNYIDACSAGINVGGVASRSVISNNSVLNCVHGVLITGVAPLGLNISDNTFDTIGGAGLSVQPSGSLTESVFSGNIIRNGQLGILLNVGTNNVFTDNNIVGASGWGIDILSNNNRIENNVVRNGTGGTAGGIRIQAAAANNALLANTVTGNAGVQISNLGANNIREKNRVSAAGALSGLAVLVAGTILVATAEILAGDTVRLTRTAPGGVMGNLTLGAIVAGTSFVINSDNAGDTSTVFWEIIH